MKLFKVTVEGISPLLMHRYAMEPSASGHSGGTSASIVNKDPKEEAERGAYRLQSGELYQPAEHIERSMFWGAKFHKIGRKSAASLVPAGIFVKERQLPHGTREYEIDSRRVVIRATGNAIVRHRPRLDSWKLSFHLEVDAAIFKKDLVLAILQDAGRKVGVGDFRPQRGGSFGRFIVTSFEEVKDRDAA
jgi:hypothetical protein